MVVEWNFVKNGSWVEQ